MANKVYREVNPNLVIGRAGLDQDVLIWECPTGPVQMYFLSTHLPLHVHDDHRV